jgi:hypothetical protein
MSDQKLTYLTFHGIPLTFTFDWPFHQSAGGADYSVLHGNALLEDGTQRHAALSIHMSQVVREALPSVEPKDALGPAINAVRKATDTKDIEFIKSTKRQPMPLSSRVFSMLSQKFTFQNPSDEQLLEFVKRKVYWAARLQSGKSWLADPVDALYLSRDPKDLLEAGKKIAAEGLITLEGEWATAKDSLMQQSATMEAALNEALAAIEAKHEFERA